MTLFDKILINAHKGYERLKRGAAVFSDRIKFELGIVRMRIRINGIRERIDELYGEIGRKAEALRDVDGAPGTFAAFLKVDEVAAALGEIEKLRKEIEEITAELLREQEDIAESLKDAGETMT